MRGRGVLDHDLAHCLKRPTFSCPSSGRRSRMYFGHYFLQLNWSVINSPLLCHVHAVTPSGRRGQAQGVSSLRTVSITLLFVFLQTQTRPVRVLQTTADWSAHEAWKIRGAQLSLAHCPRLLNADQKFPSWLLAGTPSLMNREVGAVSRQVSRGRCAHSLLCLPSGTWMQR